MLCVQVTKRRQIEDMKTPRGAKAGVLPCILWFKEFAEKAETIIMGTDRRIDLDKAYHILVDALFKTIDRVAGEHPKTPADVIKFGKSHNKLTPTVISTVSSRKLSQFVGHSVKTQDKLLGGQERHC